MVCLCCLWAGAGQDNDPDGPTSEVTMPRLDEDREMSKDSKGFEAIYIKAIKSLCLCLESCHALAFASRRRTSKWLCGFSTWSVGSDIAPRGSRPGDAVGHHRSLHHGIHFSKQQFTLTFLTMQIFATYVHLFWTWCVRCVKVGHAEQYWMCSAWSRFASEHCLVETRLRPHRTLRQAGPQAGATRRGHEEFHRKDKSLLRHTTCTNTLVVFALYVSWTARFCFPQSKIRRAWEHFLIEFSQFAAFYISALSSFAFQQCNVPNEPDSSVIHQNQRILAFPALHACLDMQYILYWTRSKRAWGENHFVQPMIY